MKDLRLLRLLYWEPSNFAEDPEQMPDYPLRDAKPANDGNLYPYNSKIRPPPYWNPSLSPVIPTIGPIPRKGPPFVPPQPQTNPPPGEDNGRNGAW